MNKISTVRSASMALAISVAFSVAVVVPPPARAAAAVAPVDGATVPSRPVFQWDFLYGTAEVEWSRVADVNVAGDQAGAFVDGGGSTFDLLYDHVPVDGVTVVDRRLNSGRWFWHARLRDDGGPEGYGQRDQWTPTRTMIVASEEPVFEGLTLRARRVKRHGSCYPVRISGTARASDNEDVPRLRLAFVLRSSAGVIARSPGTLADAPLGSASYVRDVCTRSRVSKITATILDASGARSSAISRAVAVTRG